MILSWFKDGRPRHSFWLFAPFALALPAGVLLSYPDRFGTQIALAFGWFLLTLVYAATWQTARFAAGRKPRFALAFLACFVPLVISLTLGSAELHAQWRMLPRALLMAVFCLLAAREFRRLADRHLPSAQALAWVFLGFGIFHALRSPLAFVLPAPFGARDVQVWAIAAFNFQIVLNGLLLGVFMTTLGRERISMHHFHLAMVDPLTGVGNRRAFDRRLAQILGDGTADHAGANKDRPLAVAVLDIDNFKAVNDRFGHSFGDIVIAGAANIACDAIGHRNVFRLGGEEFAVVIEGHRPPIAEAMVEGMRLGFSMLSHVANEVSHRATLSAGVAIAGPHSDAGDLLSEADRALYLAKALGRNRTVVADEATMSRLMDEALHDMVPDQKERGRANDREEGDGPAKDGDLVPLTGRKRA